MSKNYFITTAIPYINAPVHIGHAQEFLLADTFKHILQKQGHKVLLQSGTDDNSLKNILAAKEIGKSIEEYTKEQGELFKKLLNSLNIHPDVFVQTSSKLHHDSVKYFIQNLNQDDLYENNYCGLYCVGCEDFIKEEDLNQKEECKDHLKKPDHIQEKNIFFRLSKYQDQIYKLIESDTVKIYPSWRKKEILNFINSGLTDISISRPIKDESWGISFPNYPNHTVYVWIDALINYISGIGYGTNNEWEKIWNESYKIHVIGKNVWKFHAIYWIGLLLSSKISPPDEIVIHGFLTNEGVKISKSLGNSISPVELLENYDADTLKCYLLGKLNYENDSDFSKEDLSKFYLDEVINQISNLFPRIYSLAKKENIILENSKQNYQLNFREIQDIYTTLLSLSQKLNKEVNDSFIWKSLDKTKNDFLIKDWNNQLNRISSLFSLLYKSKETEINKAFTEKVILFNKPKKELI